MNILRNTLAVLVGLFIAMFIITVGIRAVPQWRVFDSYSPFAQWRHFLKSMMHDRAFYWFLLFISGVGSMVGGVVTAVLVKYAKVAYAILIGYIMLSLAVLDIIIFPYHPTFYKILIFLTFFPFAWLGGKLVEVIYERKQRRIGK